MNALDQATNESSTAIHNGQCSSHSPVPLESVLCTEELNRRPSRCADYEAENRALVALAQALADSPQTILQKLAETTLEVFRADSAGLSLLTEDGKRFHWPAIAGMWKPHIGGGTPRDFGPCGDVLDRNIPLLFKHFELRYTYFQPVTPSTVECLLVPFYVQGKAVGTIWAIAHDDRRKFDAEDLRQLVSLGRFASSAYQTVASMDALARRGDALEAEITERKIAEDALRDSDRRKSEFLAMLAHELRNPLAPICHALQFIRARRGNKSPSGDEFHSVAEMMERQISQMVRLVDDLLDVSRISRGKIALRKGRVELASVVNHAVEAACSLYESRKHELTVTLPTQPIYLNADPTRLAQVVGNLLNNAFKFTDTGGRIWLTVERDGEQALIRVRDTGLGIAADQLPRIFDMFMQVDSTLERSITGLGIGLTLVKTLVEMHDGTMTGHSAGVGQGSEFVVRLPILADTAKPPPAPIVNEPMLTTARRILVVDDNRDSATSLAMLLKLAGNETHTAYDGLEAVEKAAAVKPDVILLDIGLPKLNGFEAARKIREQPWSKDAVLVALTGWGQDEDRQRSKEAGFNAHMVKPVELPALMNLLAEL